MLFFENDYKGSILLKFFKKIILLDIKIGFSKFENPIAFAFVSYHLSDFLDKVIISKIKLIYMTIILFAKPQSVLFVLLFGPV